MGKNWGRERGKGHGGKRTKLKTMTTTTHVLIHMRGPRSFPSANDASFFFFSICVCLIYRFFFRKIKIRSIYVTFKKKLLFFFLILFSHLLPAFFTRRRGFEQTFFYFQPHRNSRVRVLSFTPSFSFVVFFIFCSFRLAYSLASSSLFCFLHCIRTTMRMENSRLRSIVGASNCQRSTIEASSRKTVQVERLPLSGGSLAFLPFIEHHFKYDLYNVVLLHVSFSCSRRNNRSRKLTRFSRGLIAIWRLIPDDDAFVPLLLDWLLDDPVTSSFGFFLGPIACSAVKFASLCLSSSISALCIYE